MLEDREKRRLEYLAVKEYPLGLELELSIGAARTLRRLNCKSIDDVAFLSEIDFLRVPGCGIGTLAKIKTAITTRGRHLGECRIRG